MLGPGSPGNFSTAGPDPPAAGWRPGTPQHLQVARGGGGEGVLDSCPYLHSESLKVCEQLFLLLLLTAGVLREELLLPHDQCPAHLLKLLLVNLLVVQFILYEEKFSRCVIGSSALIGCG